MGTEGKVLMWWQTERCELVEPLGVIGKGEVLDIIWDLASSIHDVIK